MHMPIWLKSTVQYTLPLWTNGSVYWIADFNQIVHMQILAEKVYEKQTKLARTKI